MYAWLQKLFMVCIKAKFSGSNYREAARIRNGFCRRVTEIPVLIRWLVWDVVSLAAFWESWAVERLWAKSFILITLATVLTQQKLAHSTRVLFGINENSAHSF